MEPRTRELAIQASADQRWAAAAGLWHAVTAACPFDGHAWSRLGEARTHAGDLPAAIAAHERADQLGHGFPFEPPYEIAAAYARLGEPDAALAWLGRAIERGLRDLLAPRDDERFSTLRDDPRFRELIGWIDTSGLDRTAGWALDLRCFGRELKRRAYAPFAHITEAELDARLAALAAAIDERTDLQIVLELQRLLVRLRDGHADIRLPHAPRQVLPLVWSLFEEGLFVTAAAPALPELVGAQVIRIGPLAVPDAMAAVDGIITRDNDYWPRFFAPLLLRNLSVLHALGLAERDDTIELTVQGMDDGTVRSVAVAAEREERTPFPRQTMLPPDGWLWLPKLRPGDVPAYLQAVELPHWSASWPERRIVYAQVNAVRDGIDRTLRDFSDQVVDLAEELPGTRLVLDLRWNGGGNTFLAMPLLHRLIGSRAINRRGRLFVIVGRRTFSAAQNLATLLERHTEAIFAGEPTGSSPTFVGETVEFRLPYSGAVMNVSDLLWQSGWPMDRRPFIAPELHAPPTFAAFRDNRDVALEAILAFAGP